MKTLLMSTAAAMLVAGSAYAADVAIIVDTDNDGFISASEYNAALAERNDAYWFDAWDTDGDGMISRDDFVSGNFATYDVDGDEMLSQDELRAWDSDNIRYNAMRSGREVEEAGPAGGAAAGAAAGAGGQGSQPGAGGAATQ